MAEQELLWKQYSVHVDLYKFYLNVVIKLNTFHYAIKGAILSVYLAKVSQIPMIKWALVLPIALSLCLAVLYVYGAIFRKSHGKTFLGSVRTSALMQHRK